MTPEEKAAVINARCTTAMIRALGMQAENNQRQHLQQSMAYIEKDFLKIIEDEGTHWNSFNKILFDY